jgi:hypothetical protein
VTAACTAEALDKTRRLLYSKINKKNLVYQKILSSISKLANYPLDNWQNLKVRTILPLKAGVPDSPRYNIPNWGKTKDNKIHIRNSHTMYVQITAKYTKMEVK